MTAGTEALAEAARLETARVYGRTDRHPHAQPVSEEAAAANWVQLCRAVRDEKAARIAELRPDYLNREAG